MDSSVLLDLASADPVWGAWSARAITDVEVYSILIINPIVYAEVSIRYSTIEALDEAFPASVYHREQLPWEAGFLAGKCFLQYRRRGGLKTSPIADFYIGAHAAVGGLALLTRDAARYRSYFPAVEILAPTEQAA